MVWSNYGLSSQMSALLHTISMRERYHFSHLVPAAVRFKNLVSYSLHVKLAPFFYVPFHFILYLLGFIINLFFIKILFWVI